jgi:ribosome-associated translation inhibitor RaiA
MEVIFHTHHATISDDLRDRAERTVRKLAERVSRPVDAIIRFEQDGSLRHVELELRSSRRGRPLIARGCERAFGPALAEAAARMEGQLMRGKRTPKSRAAEAPRP